MSNTQEHLLLVYHGANVFLLTRLASSEYFDKTVYRRPDCSLIRLMNPAPSNSKLSEQCTKHSPYRGSTGGSEEEEEGIHDGTKLCAEYKDEI